MARKEKELHMQLYPGWSARDNYATRTKKKKMKRDVSAITSNYETKLGILLFPYITHAADSLGCLLTEQFPSVGYFRQAYRA